MLRTTIKSLLLTITLIRKILSASTIPGGNTLRLVTNNVYYTTDGDHLFRFAKSKSQYLLVTTKNNTIHLPHLATSNRYVIPMSVTNFTGYGGIDCWESEDTCVICGVGGCFTVKLDSAGYTFDKRYYHNKYEFKAPWNTTYRDFVFDVLALRTTSYFFTAESHVGDNSAGILRYDLTGDSCFTNFTARLRERSVDIPEYHLAQHRFTRNLGATSVGSGHLWILSVNDLSTPVKTYQFSPSSGLGLKVGPMSFFEDNFTGANRMVICNRFWFKNACFSFDYGTGTYRHIYQFDSQGDKLVNATEGPAEMVFVQTFSESRFFVFIYKNTFFIQEDSGVLPTKLSGNDEREPVTNTMVEYISNTGNDQFFELVNTFMLSGYKDGFLYKEAIAINPHEIISIQYGYVNSEPANADGNPIPTKNVCAEACGYWRKKGTDNVTPIHSDNGQAGAFSAVPNTVANPSHIEARQNIKNSRSSGTNEYKNIACQYAHRPQDCIISTVEGGSCRDTTTPTLDYGFKSNTAADILKCQQRDPGLIGSIGGKIVDPKDATPFSTTGQICTNKTSAKTESVTQGTSSSSSSSDSSGMSDGTKTALIIGGICLGVILIGGLIFALAGAGKKKPNMMRGGNYTSQGPMNYNNGNYNNGNFGQQNMGRGMNRKMSNNNSLMGNSSVNTNQLVGSQMGAFMGNGVPANEDGTPINTPHGPGDDFGDDVGMVSQYDGHL